MAEMTMRKGAEKLLKIDEAAREAALPLRDGPAMRALSWASEIGDQPQLRMVSGAVLAAGLLRRDRRLARAGLRMIVAHELTTLVKDAIKRRIDRTRPRSADGNGDHKVKPGRNTAKEETSFPSGHSAGAAAVARALAREFPEHRAAAYGAAGFVALAQVPRCAHYPTDVGAGLTLGTLAEAASAVLMSALKGGTA